MSALSRLAWASFRYRSANLCREARALASNCSTLNILQHVYAFRHVLVYALWLAGDVVSVRSRLAVCEGQGGQLAICECPLAVREGLTALGVSRDMP